MSKPRILVRLMAPTLVAALLLPVCRATAEPTPKEYDVRIHYQIDAFRNERLLQFFPMVRYLEKVGLQRDAGPEDEAENPQVTRMTGTIAAGNARKLLGERHVRAILLVPREAKLPEGKAPVRVHLELASLLNAEQERLLAGGERAQADDLAGALAALERQRLFADAVRAVLRDLGFREAIGYDERQHTRLVGMIPADKLDPLLEDLRRQPAAAKLPAPLPNRWPVRVIEVMSLLPFPVERPVPLLPAKGEESITAEVRTLLADTGVAAKPMRMEVILAATPAADDHSWRRSLQQAAPLLAVEGHVGPLVTVFGPANQAVALARQPFVSTIRLPRSGEPRSVAGPAGKDDGREALQAAGIARLHTLGRRGKGYRVALIDGDFRGWKGPVGKELPAHTTYLDLTAERNATLLPDPLAGEPQAMGHGTRLARAAALAAPEAEFTLIRIDPAAPHQLLEVARFISGESFLGESLEERDAELVAEQESLGRRAVELAQQRRRLLDENVSLDPDLAKKPEAFGLDPVQDKKLIERQHAYVKARATYEADEQIQHDRFQRYLRLRSDLARLKGIQVVASTLVWNEGQPVDGSSALSRFFDDRPFRAALWLQSAGATRGQSWSGLFRDADGNGVLEFTVPGTPLKDGRWSPELNFLAWQPDGKAQTADLPAGARVRISVQWREAHDPEFWGQSDDPYRPSLADLNLVLLHQFDPEGAKRPVDDLEVVAQSSSLPQRLDNQPNAATYEQTVEYVVKQAGRYALRIEGRIPSDIRPAGAAALPALRKVGELRPRLFVATLDGAGRAVFADYTPVVGSLGVPADAHLVITVGAVDLGNHRRPYSAGGPPHNMELLQKPDVLAYDALAEGDAAGFAAGVTASALSAGTPKSQFLEALHVLPGGVLRVRR